MSQRASVTVPVPADELFSWLRDVGSWPDLLQGLAGVDDLGYHRYRWTVVFGGEPETCDVVITADPVARRISWKHLRGRPFDGSFRLTPQDGRTVVELSIDVKPVGLAEGIADFTNHGSAMAETDARRLYDAVEAWAALRHQRADAADPDVVDAGRTPRPSDGEAVG